MIERLTEEQLKEFLDTKYEKFANREFVESDPIQVPKSFVDKYDIEISAFITATIAWGQRKSIIKNAFSFMNLMDNAPYDFVVNHQESDLIRFNGAVHRTFNALDLVFFISSLKNIYLNHAGLESVLSKDKNMYVNLVNFHKVFFELPHLKRTVAHLANVERGSAAKRLNMFIRWMVRKDNKGVDFGLWENISPADIYIPLDVHSGRIARMIGLLERKQNDWKAVVELTNKLKTFDYKDPIKYDFALFGVGVNEDF